MNQETVFRIHIMFIRSQLETHAAIFKDCLYLFRAQLWNDIRYAANRDVHDGLTCLPEIIHSSIDVVIHFNRQQRSHCINRVVGRGKLRGAQIETSSEMPVFIVLEREDIDEELEVVQRRMTDHLYVIIDIEASDFLEVLGQTVETTLHTITVLVILHGRLTTHLYRKVNTVTEMRHELVTCTQLYIVAKGRSHIEADAGGTQVDRDIKMLEIAKVTVLTRRNRLTRLTSSRHGTSHECYH